MEPYAPEGFKKAKEPNKGASAPRIGARNPPQQSKLRKYIAVSLAWIFQIEFSTLIDPQNQPKKEKKREEAETLCYLFLL